MYDDPALSPDYEAPPWLNGKTVDEVIFADEYLRNHPMKCINGQLFTVDGPVGDLRAYDATARCHIVYESIYSTYCATTPQAI